MGPSCLFVRSLSAALGQVFLQKVANAESRKRFTTAVPKHRLIRLIRIIGIAYEVVQQLRCTFPDGTQAHLVAFTSEAYMLGRIKSDISSLQIQDLLHPCASIENRREQRVIASTGSFGASIAASSASTSSASK